MTKQRPQDTLNVPGQIIAWFDDLGTGNEEHRFLSNFYEGEPFTLPGVTVAAAFGQQPDGRAAEENLVKFKTGEHAFAAMKAWGASAEDFYEIVNADGPGLAKGLGRHCKLREDWEVVKLDVMAAVVRAKFTLDRFEGNALLNTGTALLIEGTYWGDDVWGVDLEGDPTTSWGSNWLGTLLMARRAELTAEKLYGKTTRAGEKNAKTAVHGWLRPAWMS